MAELETCTLRTHRSLGELETDWVQLYGRSESTNPFAHPAWLIGWADHFVPPGDLLVVTVCDRQGCLVGVAPFYRRHIGIGPIRLGTQLDLMGARPDVGLMELPQILTDRGREREVLRAVMAHLEEEGDRWDWAEITLTPEQGWFEISYLPRDYDGRRGFVVQKFTRVFVIMHLAPSWEAVQAGLGRNVKESIRRGVNRLKREGKSWAVRSPADRAELDTALRTFTQLHGMRAGLEGKERHQDYFSQAGFHRFFMDVAPKLFDAGHLCPYLMEVDGQPIASRLVLNAHDTVYLSASGMDPAWWHYGANTTLMTEVLRDAVARGLKRANLSAGADESKLRWSEHLEQYPVFLVVQARRRSVFAFHLFWLARSAMIVPVARRRYRRR